MKPLLPSLPELSQFNPGIHLTKATQKSAGNWAHQLVKLFPSTAATILTPDFLAAISAVFMEYPEAVLASVCSPSFGISAKQDYFPSLNQLKKSCEDAAFELGERERRMAASKRKPVPKNQDDLSNCYTGPIENIKPGDILHSTRFEEYRTFMKTKHSMQSVKLWGSSEQWRDNGQRPFAKPLTAKQEETNPFEK